MSSSSGWLSDTTANKIKHSYINGFLDVSGSSKVYQSVDYAWNAYGQIISGKYDSDNNVRFGEYIDMDASGVTVVTGGYGDEPDGAGYVYRYNETADIWYQLGNRIYRTGSTTFGRKSVISADGTTVAFNDGNAYVSIWRYNSVTNTWDTLGDSPIQGTTNLGNGASLSINSDGTVVAAHDNSNGMNIFKLISGTWTNIGTMSGGNGNKGVIDGSGTRIVFAHNSTDEVKVFDYSGGTTWNQVGSTLTGFDFGANGLYDMIDISRDGSTIAFNSYTDGVIYVYQYDNSESDWVQKGKRIGNVSNATCKLSGNGDTLIFSNGDTDTIYVNKFVNNDWLEQGKSFTFTGTGDAGTFGVVVLNDDGTKCAVGSALADINGNNSGVIQMFQWSKKAYTKPLLDANNQTMTIWGGAEHNADNYLVTQLGADIDEYNNNGAGSNERSNTLFFSSDGTTLYIGHQLGYNEYGERTGTFRVMKYRNGEWYKIGPIIAPRSSEVGVFQGTLGNTYYNSGGLSSDGTRAMGGWRNEDTDSSTEQKGLIRVYDLSGDDWVQVGNDIVGDSAGDLIAGIMSGDGNTVAYRDTNSTYAKIRTYNSSTNTWVLQTTISTGSLTIMSLSYDGTIRIDSDISTSGDYKLTAYKYANGSWSQIGQELKSYEVANNEAFTVSKLSKYGDYLLVGDQDSFSSTGVAIVYKYSSEADKWMQLGGNIQNPFATEVIFASAGGISADGKTIVLTDYTSRGSDDYQGNDGAIAVYKYFDGNWTQIFNYDGLEDDSQLGAGADMCDNGELFAVSSAGSYFARTYQITNNPALKIEDGITTMNGNVAMSGNVGIGTDNPVCKLDVWGGIHLRGENMGRIKRDGVSDDSNRTNTYIGFGPAGSDNDWAYLRQIGGSNAINLALDFHDDHNDCGFVIRSVHSTQNPDIIYTRFCVAQGGNVGIGTNSPSRTLHVHSSSGDPYLQLTSTNTGTGTSNGFHLQCVNSSKDANLVQRESANMKFYTSNTERMRINSSGNVGIGTTNPGYKLDVNGFFHVNGGSKIVVQGEVDGGSTRGIYLWKHDSSQWGIYMGQAGVGRSLSGGNAPDGFEFNSYAIRFRIAKSSNHGFIFENDSNQALFTIRGDGHTFLMRATAGEEDGPILRMQNSSDGVSTFWDIIANDGADESIDFEFNSQTKGYIDTTWNDRRMNTFTGQHICDVRDITYKESDKYIGLIVSANNNEYVSVNNHEIKKGIEAIEVEESVPLVSLTTKQKDKSCFGVISKKENHINRSQANGSWMTVVERELGDNRVYINSLGEGAIWVSNAKGNLESGDYITTSMLPGYGEKQDDDLLHNYTVAKITMDCNFQPALKNKQKIKRIDVEFYTDSSNNTYDMSNNLIHWGSEELREGHNRKYTIQHYNKTFDVSKNVISVTQNVLNENGDLIWEDSTEQERAYQIRHLDPSGNIITEEEYNTKIAASEEAYIAAFVGCTYHCG